MRLFPGTPCLTAALRSSHLGTDSGPLSSSALFPHVSSVSPKHPLCPSSHCQSQNLGLDRLLFLTNKNGLMSLCLNEENPAGESGQNVEIGRAHV